MSGIRRLLQIALFGMRSDRGNDGDLLGEQVAVIYAGTRGYLDTVAVNRIGAYQTSLISKLKSSHAQILDGIRTQKALTPELENALKAALDDFGKTFS